jgi:hypothetical protein
MEQKGWKCRVIARAVFDKHLCSKQFHDYVLVKGGLKRLYLVIMKNILTFRPNLILVRSRYELLPIIRFFAPRTPIVLQLHGSEIRGKSKLPKKAGHATKIIVSTKDLSKWGEYYGTPISPAFAPPEPGVRQKGTALFLRTKYGARDCLEDATRFCEEHGLDMTVIDRTKGEYIPHTEMPVLMQKFEWYLDLKGLTSGDVLSKTAIEFLHTTSERFPGKVLTDDGTIVTEFRTTTNEEYYELFETLAS